MVTDGVPSVACHRVCSTQKYGQMTSATVRESDWSIRYMDEEVFWKTAWKPSGGKRADEVKRTLSGDKQTVNLPTSFDELGCSLCSRRSDNDVAAGP
jgi:hypothetical protein